MLRALILLTTLLFAMSPAEAAKRVALVIGNANYVTVGTLFTPLRDVPMVAKALEDVGFEVTIVTDVKKEAMQEALRAFSELAADAEVALVYYAGHGFEAANVNYLVPVNAKLKKATDARFEAVDLADVRAAVAGASKLRMVVLDACRNNPFPLEAKDGKRAARSRGLGEVKPGFNELIAYSAQEGVVADDGPRDGNSPFATALVKWLVEPGLEIRFAMGHVRDEVMANTGPSEERDGPQIPYIEGSLGGEQIFFKEPPEIAKVEKKEAAPAPDTLAADYELARSIGTKSAWEAFVARHAAADDFRVDLAKAELKTFDVAIIDVPPKAPDVVVQKSNCATLLASVGGAETCLKPGDEFADCDGCPRMVVIPAGRFTMGSPKGELGRSYDEEPQHEVTIAKAFAVGRFEVTFDEWQACVDGGGCTGNAAPGDEGWGRSRHPVINVSWDNAQQYVQWLSAHIGQRYRLLSEAEWEYAARAGTKTEYGSRSIRNQHAEFNWVLDEVGSYDANAFGLYDMYGNAWEWAEDCYVPSYKGAPITGAARISSSDCKRVVRGGGMVNFPRHLRSAHRNGLPGGDPVDVVSFRVARTL